MLSSLDCISCFPYENYLRHVKRSVRSSNRPFQQVINRLSEMENFPTNKAPKTKVLCQKEHTMGPVVDGYECCVQYTTVETSEFVLNISDRDNCIITKTGCVGIVKNVLSHLSEIFFVVCLFSRVTALFEYPLLSSELDIYSVSHLQDTFTVISLTDVQYKGVRLPVDNSSAAVIPIVHSSE